MRVESPKSGVPRPEGDRVPGSLWSLDARSWTLGVVFVVWTVIGCGRTAEPRIDQKPGFSKKPGFSSGGVPTAARFQTMTSESGVKMTYRNGEEAGHYAILETVGGGGAWFDYDGDGDVDLVLTGGGSYGRDQTIRGRRSVLYRNQGRWRFSEVTESAGCDLAPYYSHGVAVADYDSDGFPDFVVTGYGGLLLYRNMGDGTFIEVSRGAGLIDPQWSTAAAFGDVDGDGHLDLYVAHYVDWSFENHPQCKAAGGDKPEVCSPREFQGLPDRLFRSTGTGAFEDVSSTVGLRPDGKGLGVLAADIDADADLDLYVANDTTANFLYQNDGAGRLEEIGLMSSTAFDDAGTADGSMGVALGDFNGDGLFDLWVANFEHESFALYRNNGGDFFTHVSRMTGITDVAGLYVGWGTAFLDFDNDGDQDILSSNGHVMRHPVNGPVRQRPLLFENRDARRFVNVAPQAGKYMNSPHDGRGLATGDVDNDGDLDLAISHLNEPAALLSNEADTDHHWLGLHLIGITSPRDAIGAVVRVHTAGGSQIRQQVGGGSYLSSSDPRILFGLGENDSVEQVEVVWPSGSRQVLPDVPVDRMLTVREGHAALSTVSVSP